MQFNVTHPCSRGLFLFDAFFPLNYPASPPKVQLVTTGGGQVRFNPNLYACGKVCLSLLGTWSGAETEKWNPGVSNFHQVLLSIQSLILVSEPYFNEPGYERRMGTAAGAQQSEMYNISVQVNTIRWAMLAMLRSPPVGFEQIVRTHFRLVGRC